MPTFISMLRGINVGGHRKVPMNELREAYTRLGFSNVKSYIQSGNVVFDSKQSSSAKVGALIEAKLKEWLGGPVPVIVRTSAEFGKVIEGNPFLKERQEDTKNLYVILLSARPSASAMSNLATVETPNEQADEFVSGERVVYVFCPKGYGETKFNNVFFEKILKVSATARNWNTVQALYAMATEKSI